MMNIDKLKTELKDTAISFNLCKEWQAMFDRVKDKDTLLKMYVKGIDFCIKNDYPTVEYIEQNFKGDCEKHGVYVNDEIELTNARKLVLIGKCSAKLKYDSYEVAMIYVKHDSEVCIEADDHSIITVDCFDMSKVKAYAKNHAKVIINQYLGSEVSNKTDETGEVKIFNHKSIVYQKP